MDGWIALVLKLYLSICMYITFNIAATAFESGFTKHFDAAIINLAFVGCLCNLGVQYVLRSFLFITVTLRLNLFPEIMY